MSRELRSNVWSCSELARGAAIVADMAGLSWGSNVDPASLSKEEILRAIQEPGFYLQVNTCGEHVLHAGSQEFDGAVAASHLATESFNCTSREVLTTGLLRVKEEPPQEEENIYEQDTVPAAPCHGITAYIDLPC